MQEFGQTVRFTHRGHGTRGVSTGERRACVTSHLCHLTLVSEFGFLTFKLANHSMSQIHDGVQTHTLNA